MVWLGTMIKVCFFFLPKQQKQLPILIFTRLSFLSEKKLSLVSEKVEFYLC